MSDTVRRLLFSAVAAACLVGVYVSMTMVSSASHKPQQALPRGVVQVYPPPGDIDLRQTAIGVYLASGYQGVLFVDGREVPDDDLHRVAATGQIQLQPQPDSDFRNDRLGPGQHRATVLYWPPNSSRSDAHSYSWSFHFH